MVRWLSISLRGAGLLGALAALALMLAACGGSGGGANAKSNDLSGANISGSAGGTAAPTTASAVTIINISDNKFDPAEVTIKAGDTVRWVWSGSNPHSVLIAGEDSGQHTGSGTYERKFPAGGVTFPFQCGVHGAAMAGKITVQ